MYYQFILDLFLPSFYLSSVLFLIVVLSIIKINKAGDCAVNQKKGAGNAETPVLVRY